MKIHGVLALSALFLVACGQPAVPPDSPKPVVAQWTSEEISKLFLDGATVWRYESKPGIPVKSVQLELQENGIKRSSIGQTSPVPRAVSKIIIVDSKWNDTHLLKMYVDYDGGSGVMSSGGWFSKTLTMSASAGHTSAEPIRTGTITLVSGTTAIATDEHPTIEFHSETAPCRLQLVIE